MSGEQGRPHPESLSICIGQLAKLKTRRFQSIEQIFGFDFG